MAAPITDQAEAIVPGAVSAEVWRAVIIPAFAHHQGATQLVPPTGPGVDVSNPLPRGHAAEGGGTKQGLVRKPVSPAHSQTCRA